MNDPENETEQMEAEHIPPMMVSCAKLYRGSLRIKTSNEADAPETDTVS
jgi:hypothetical protein